MENDKSLRKHLQKLLDWQDAHASFDSAIEGIPEKFRGVKPERVCLIRCGNFLNTSAMSVRYFRFLPESEL